MMYSGKPLLIPVINELFRTDYAKVMDDIGSICVDTSEYL